MTRLVRDHVIIIRGEDLAREEGYAQGFSDGATMAMRKANKSLDKREEDVKEISERLDKLHNRVNNIY